jgi:hypothetical protein
MDMTIQDHKLLLLTLALLSSTLACRAATRLIYSDTPVPPAPLPTAVQPSPTPTQVTEAQSCPILLSDIMSAATAPGNDTEPQDEQYLVTYTVSGDQISNPHYERVNSSLKDKQEDRASQEFVWNYFTAIIPADERKFVTEYSITTDGVDNSLAAVVQTYDDPNHWALEVDILDIGDTYNLTFTLIHEFGHLLTLNAEQVPPSIRVFNNPDDEDIFQQEVAKCPEYFPGEGCSMSTSYINTFYNRFWMNIYDEWNKINDETEDAAYYQALDDFYYKHEDQFVTNYAVTDPEEDIAESWAFFVLAPKPNGSSIADQKVLFFYEYPELVQLRQEILNSVCESFPK